jgi:hypothetical protein
VCKGTIILLICCFGFVDLLTISFCAYRRNASEKARHGAMDGTSTTSREPQGANTAS